MDRTQRSLVAVFAGLTVSTVGLALAMNGDASEKQKSWTERAIEVGWEDTDSALARQLRRLLHCPRQSKDTERLAQLQMARAAWRLRSELLETASHKHLTDKRMSERYSELDELRAAIEREERRLIGKK